MLLDEKKATVFFLKKDISLDFGGYAKGYALLKMRDLINQAGVKHCFVDFGGSSILGIGHHPYGDSWKVGIENSYNRDEVFNEVSLNDLALSVSGNSPSYTGHIVHPTSGEAIKEDRIVSITSEDPSDAEVLSTVFMIANDTQKKQITENFKIYNIAEF